MIKQKAIAHYIAKITGKDPNVLRFNANATTYLDVVSMTEHGDADLLAHSTIGLSAHATNQEKRDMELLLVADKKYELAPNILATAGLKAILEGWQVTTGAIFLHIFSSYYPDQEVRHGLLLPPYLWKDSLKALDLGDRLVEWKMIIPITDTEAAYIQNHPPSTLLPLFVAQKVNLFDLGRESVLLQG